MINKENVNIKITPHIQKVEWSVGSASIDFNTETMTINLLGKQIIDYLDMEIIIN